MSESGEQDEVDELIGREFDGRFRLDALLGEGGMGRVYRGRQLSVNRDVAVKVLHGELTLNEELRKRFFREADVVSDLSHPNIVRLIDFGRDEETGLLYLVMDLVDGYGLDELIDRGRLQPELALRVAHQVAGALIEAHEAGVVHRDMKAENLLLEPVADGTLQCKVVDFGIAYPGDASEKLTMTGRVYGTASYMAPEQARGEEVDQRADLFSLGIMMFEMLVGRLPIEGANSMEVLIRQIQDGPPLLSDVVPPGFVDDDVATLVDRLLAPAPPARPESAAEVRDELDAVFEREDWGPLRLETDRAGIEMFDPWIAAPFDFRDSAEALREADAPLPTTGGSGAGGAGSAEKTVDAMPNDGTDRQWEEANPTARPPADGGGPGNPADGPSEDESSSRLLVLVAIAIGMLVLGGVVLGGYFAFQYVRPEADGLDEVANPGAASEPAPSGDEPASASDDETDSVCGSIERAAVPDGWLGGYRPQGDENSGHRLSLSEEKLNLRWGDGGATLFLARTDDDGRGYQVSCARYVGHGDGERCSGSIRRIGPVLNIALHGTDVCETRISGTWIAE